MASQSWNEADYQAPALGARLRNTRRAERVSLRDLARRSGLSPALLSKIETGKTGMTLRQFDAIRRALNVPVSALLPSDAVSHYVITRRETMADHLSQPTSRAWAEVRLADTFAGKRIEPFYYRNDPYDDRDVRLVAHETEHFIFVLRGTLEVFQADDGAVVKEQVRPGDALYWHCDVPHASRGGDGGSVEFFTVRYLTHGMEDTLDHELGTRRRPALQVGLKKDVVSESARKIAFMRRSRGLTAAELAGLAQIGVRQLVAIESGRRTADLVLLFRLARIFRRPVRYFLGSDDRGGPARAVLRADAIDRLPEQRRGQDVFVSLADGMPQRAMHPYHVRLAVNRPPALVQHGGQTCVYVLHGEVEFRTMLDGREVVEILRAGDSLFLDCGVPYDLRGYSRSPYPHATADMIQVFWNSGGTAPPFLASL